MHLASPGAAPSIIVFPYNPATLCRTLQPAAAQGPGNLGPDDPENPVQTIVFSLAMGDAAAVPAPGAPASAGGVDSVLAALELLMYPASNTAGSLTLFVWGPNRIIPVRITGLSIQEEMFDPNLAPIQATAEVTLSVAPGDLPGTDFLQKYIAALNSLAASANTAQTSLLGITNLR